MKYKMEKLKDWCNLINGYAFKGKDFTHKGVPVIKIANVKPNKIVLDNLQCVPEDVAKKAEKSRIFKNDILLTMSGNRVEGTPDTWVGKACIFRETGEYILNQRVCIIRPNLNVFDSTYLSYVLSSWNSQLYFIQRATSSGGQANISPAIIRDMEVPCPSMDIQKKIAYVLNVLDEKMRINEAINECGAKSHHPLAKNTNP